MPTVFHKFGLRFYFVSFDCSEPLHIHVSDDSKKICKYWLKNNEAIFADNIGFTKRDLSKIQKTVEENYQIISDRYYEHCKDFKRK